VVEFLRQRGVSLSRNEQTLKTPLLQCLDGPSADYPLARSFLECGTDPNEAGLIFRRDWSYHGDLVLVTPLQQVVSEMDPQLDIHWPPDEPPTDHPIPDMLKALINKGARCFHSARHAAAAGGTDRIPVAAESSSEGDGGGVRRQSESPDGFRMAVSEGDSHVFSRTCAVSPIVAVCKKVHPSLASEPLQLLLEKAGANPNLPGNSSLNREPLLPLEAALSRLTDMRARNPSFGSAAWSLIETLVVAGTDLNKIPSTPFPHAGDPLFYYAPEWLCCALSIPEARGPLLERLIRRCSAEFLSRAVRLI